MSKSRLKRLLAAAVAVVAVTGLGVAIPEAAYAAAPACNGWAYSQVTDDMEWHTPIANSGGVRTRGCKMQQGSTGVAVLVLQEALNACFNEHLSTDGQFGPNTKAALMRAQAFINSYYGAGLGVDGQYGPQTASWWWDSAYGRYGGAYIRGFSTCVIHYASLDDDQLSF